MPRLKWGEGSRLFDEGLDRGVLYLGSKAVPWNGLVSVEEDPRGSVDTEYYYEGNRLWVTQEIGDFTGKISAYTYPDEFAEYDGYSAHNPYRRFGMSYRTKHGDGYKLHLIYSMTVDMNARSWATKAERLDPSLFVWDISAATVPIPGSRPSARMSMEVTSDPTVLAGIEDILYGTATKNARLPSPAELYALYEAATVLRITYNNDGTYTAVGPDDMVRLLGDGYFELTAPSVFLENQDIFRVSSY